MNKARRLELIEPIQHQQACQYRVYPRAARISAHRFAAALLLLEIVAFALAGLTPALMYDGIAPVILYRYIPVIVGGGLLFLLTARALNAYRTQHVFEWRRTIPRVVASLAITFFALMVAGAAMKSTGAYSRVWFFSWIALSVMSIITVRALLLAVAEAKLTKGACLQRALIVTCGENAFTAEQLALETGNRIRAVGKIIVPDLDAMPELGPYIRDLSPEIVILNLPLTQIEAGLRKVSSLSHHAVEVLVLPQTSTAMRKALRLRRLGSHVLLQIGEPPLNGWDRAAKRIEDLVIASVALVVASPILLLTAIAIKIDSKGPVLFRQKRAGFNGALIDVWKFRSMCIEGTDLNASRQTSKDDPRVTRIGRFIRRTSIDELPQFWNVIQGTMSVVGPRPHALKTSAEGQSLEALVDEYAARHRVKPGVTGWAQINGARGELRTREQVKRRVDLDLHYIESWSIFLDIKIILMTIVRVFYDPRAY